MKLTSLEDLFLEELRDTYDAEKQAVKALRQMAKHASSEELKEAFESHLTETEGQVKRLEAVFAEFDQKPRGKACEGIKGIIEEGKEVADSCEDEATCDAGLIAAAQKVEHYEIASYGCLVAWGRQLGCDEAVRLLEETLAEEKAADEKLTSIAEQVNAQAEAGDEENVETDEDIEAEEQKNGSRRKPKRATAAGPRH